MQLTQMLNLVQSELSGVKFDHFESLQNSALTITIVSISVTFYQGQGENLSTWNDLPFWFVVGYSRYFRFLLGSFTYESESETICVTGPHLLSGYRLFCKSSSSSNTFFLQKRKGKKGWDKRNTSWSGPSNPPRELSVIRSCVFWKDINTWMHLTLHQPPISICFPIGEQSTVTVPRQRKRRERWKRWERALSLLIFEICCEETGFAICRIFHRPFSEKQLT